MKKNRWSLRLMLLLLVGGIFSMTVTCATEPGTDGDPLVTLSYLNETFLSTIMEKVDGKIEERNDELMQQIEEEQQSQTTPTFQVVTLKYGQSLTGDIGCEAMLRVGTAVCVSPSAPGLIDETMASVLNNSEALVQNHLYMMTIEGRAIKATSTTVKLLVRGSYKIT